MLVVELLLDAVRPQAGDLAAHVEARLVDRVAEVLAGVTTDDQRPPPRPVAAADWLASPSTITVPDIMFSATPTPQLPATRTVASWFMPAQ
jgi:hypothetical protein